MLHETLYFESFFFPCIFPSSKGMNPSPCESRDLYCHFLVFFSIYISPSFIPRCLALPFPRFSTFFPFVVPRCLTLPFPRFSSYSTIYSPIILRCILSHSLLPTSALFFFLLYFPLIPVFHTAFSPLSSFIFPLTNPSSLSA